MEMSLKWRKAASSRFGFPWAGIVFSSNGAMGVRIEFGFLLCDQGLGINMGFLCEILGATVI